MGDSKEKVDRRGMLLSKDEERIKIFAKRIQISTVTEFKSEILSNAHDPRYFIHLGSTKVFQDFKRH